MKKTEKREEITGIVQSFNISPKGFYEGLVIKADSQTIQVNFDTEAGAYLSLHYTAGTKISLTAEMKHDNHKGEADHPVYRLVSFKDKKNNTVDFDDERPEHAVAEGKVKSLNYALHGEVNGAVLDNGDFVHMKPAGAKAVGLKVGQKITAEGEVRFSVVEHRVIEAETVNGISLHTKPKLKSA